MTDDLTETLFIVDDEEENLDVLVRALRSHYRLRTFTDPKEALEAARLAAPDAFLIDYRLPGMNGVELLTELRRIDRTVAVIMTTAYADHDDVVYSQQVKLLYRVVSKPYDPTTIVEMLAGAIRERRVRREMALHR